MRAISIMALAALGACSAASEPENVAEPVAASIEAGLWKVSHEVTSVRPTDQAPKIAVAVKAGDKTTVSTCIDEATRDKPVPALFAGDGYDCKYRDSYMKGGRLTATLSCSRPGMAGEVMMSVNGTHKGDSLTADVSATTYFTGDGDFQMDTAITGKRTGDCAAGAADAAQKG